MRRAALVTGISAVVVTVVASVTATTLTSPDSGSGSLVLSGGVPAQVATPSVDPVTRAPGTSTLQAAYTGWAREVGAAAGIPARALEAYAVAQAELAASQPDCDVTWVTLAGIGYVESAHGTITGGLRESGVPVKPVIGIALDGGPGVIALADTDQGRLDGDRRWDRAVGPFQFLPGTWQTWGSDGDDDGRVSPQDIDDAAVAAASYLCAAGSSLATSAGWQASILSYNNSSDYVAMVLAAAEHYAAAVG